MDWEFDQMARKSFSRTISNITAAVAGLVFGFGLLQAGMANPAKVLAFLDLAGSWDPSLALVMAGAISIGLGAFTVAKRRQSSLLGLSMHLPARRAIDRRLILGSLGFGVGWGLAGICPGPAIVLVGAGNAKGLVFFAAMLAGMTIFELLDRRIASTNLSSSPI